MLPYNRDISDDVETVFDALHGSIDLSDYGDAPGQIYKIISSPFLQRLRRIKQLGFVSQNFLSAQHNRYSHALGTVHIMRKVVGHLESHSPFFERVLPAIKELTGDDIFLRAKGPGRAKAVQLVKQHLLVCAAIQDVGELPYENATGRIFRPGKAIQNVVKNSGIDVSQLSNKDIFTLFFVWDPQFFEEYFGGLSKTLLTFLISGLAPPGSKISPDVLALRQMVDGAIDADRMDYVYRDALHTLGIHHSPESIIKSIVGYDQIGPIIQHVRPITEFMMTRAMLWSHVYLSPENRFRIILLRVALGEICKNKSTAQRFIGWRSEETTPDRFLSMNDLFIENVIEQVDREGPDLDEGALEAVKLLQNGARDYEYRWVRFGEVVEKNYSEPVQLPIGFYWDTYADYTERSHTLYDPGSVRVAGERYSRLGSTVLLEQCMGPFCAMLTTGIWPALPMPDHMAWFAPRSSWKKQDGLWRSLFKFEKCIQLSAHLQFNDPLKGVATVFDTRELDHFSGRAIFVAFSWQDREIIKRAVGILYELRRRYFVFLDPSAGLGSSAAKNSEDAVDEAEAVLLFTSVAYVDAYKSRPNEGIHAEVTRMAARRREIPIVPVSLDPHPKVKEGFPWDLISRENRIPVIGAALRGLSSGEFRKTIEGALEYIDKFKI